MFEHYGFSGLYVAIQAVLTLYAQGKLIKFSIFFFEQQIHVCFSHFCTVLVNRSDDGCSGGQWRRSNSHLSCVWRLRAPSPHSKTWHCRKRHHKIFNQGQMGNILFTKRFRSLPNVDGNFVVAVIAARLRLQSFGWLRDCSTNERESVLCWLRHRARAEVGSRNNSARRKLHSTPSLTFFQLTLYNQQW